MVNLKNDPWFDEQAVINRIKNLWLQLLTCRYNQDLEPMKPYFSQALYQKELNALRNDQASGWKRYALRPAVLDGQLTVVSLNPGQETLNCELFTRFTPRVLKGDSDLLLSEGKETFFHESWLLARPGGTKTPKPGAAFSVNCPNCGSPFSMYKTAKCPMCRSLIIVPDFTWTVEEITGQIG